MIALSVLVLAAACGGQHQARRDAVAAGAPEQPAATASAADSTATSISPVLGEAAQRLMRLAPERLPDTAPAAAALLERLPSSVAGAARTKVGPKEVTWADGTMVTAAPLEEAAAPGTTMRAFFDAFAASGQFTVMSRSAPADRLLWFVGTTVGSGGHPVAAVANEDGHWLFGIEGASAPALLELATRWGNLVG